MPRIPLEQTFSMGSLGVSNTAQPISPLDITSLIQAFMISNPSSNANSVFLGDQSVSTTNGIEIPPGAAPLFNINNVRQLYEIQNPQIKTWETMNCTPYQDPDFIPFICWNPSHFYLIASVAGPTNVGMIFFKNVYI
jgi:hypothetical protein